MDTFSKIWKYMWFGLQKFWSSRIWNESCRNLAAVVKARLGVYFKFWSWGGHSKSCTREMTKNNNNKTPNLCRVERKVNSKCEKKSSMGEERQIQVEPAWACQFLSFLMFGYTVLPGFSRGYFPTKWLLKSTDLRGFPLEESRRVWL